MIVTQDQICRHWARCREINDLVQETRAVALSCEGAERKRLLRAVDLERKLADAYAKCAGTLGKLCHTSDPAAVKDLEEKASYLVEERIPGLTGAIEKLLH